MNNNRYLIKRIKYVFLVLFITLGLCGCDSIDFTKLLKKSDDSEKINVNRSDDLIVVERVEELSSSENEDKTAELSNKDFSIALNEIVTDGSRFFAYPKLNEEEQNLYAEILGILSSLGTDVKVSSLDTNEIDKVFNCVLIDHPELFYISGYSYTKFVRGEKLEKITLTGTYTMKKSEIDAAQQRLDAYADKCISEYSGEGNEYKKVKHVYEYLIKHNEYDLAAPNNQNVLSVVDEGRTVCQGYAKMTQYILNRMGVFATLCEGVVKGSESHVWNVVKINNSYYHIDTTWGDASYNITSDTETKFDIPEVNYDYLCVTDEEIQKTHVVKNTISLPVCDSMEANYYVEEGLYFSELNIDQIKSAFETAKENGETYVTFKCSSSNVYAAMYAHLIEDQNIFNYVDNNNNVNYVEFKDECKISFYV